MRNCSRPTSPVDYAICPEQLITDYLVKLVQFPEALQVLEFADGRVSLVAVRAFEGGPLVGHQLRDIRKHIPNVDVRVAAIFRGDRPIVPEGTTVVEVGDEVFCLAASQNIRKVMQELRRMDKPAHRIMIAGGGNIGLRLARALESDYTVKIVEHDKPLRGTVHPPKGAGAAGRRTDESLLEPENVEEMDLFVAVTNDDENNIMSCLLAKRMGARRVVALINRRSYVDLLQRGRSTLPYPRRRHHRLAAGACAARRHDRSALFAARRGGSAGAVVHGDATSCRMVGRQIEQIELPKGTTIAALVRDDAVLMAHHDLVIQSGDHAIVFVTNKKMVPKVEKLFQVSRGFFCCASHYRSSCIGTDAGGVQLSLYIAYCSLSLIYLDERRSIAA